MVKIISAAGSISYLGPKGDYGLLYLTKKVHSAIRGNFPWMHSTIKNTIIPLFYRQGPFPISAKLFIQRALIPLALMVNCPLVLVQTPSGRYLGTLAPFTKSNYKLRGNSFDLILSSSLGQYPQGVPIVSRLHSNPNHDRKVGLVIWNLWSLSRTLVTRIGGSLDLYAIARPLLKNLWFHVKRISNPLKIYILRGWTAVRYWVHELQLGAMLQMVGALMVWFSHTKPRTANFCHMAASQSFVLRLIS